MPTKPLESILYREFSRMAAKDIIQIASSLLQELVNYSTNAFARCVTSASGEENEHLAVLSLYLHIIEMTDGIEVLVSESCAVPAIALVRSSFEALLSIEYILRKDYGFRSLSWLADYARQRLALYEMMNPSTQRGKDFLKALNETEGMGSMSLPDQVEVQKAIANMQALLARKQFKPIHREYDNFRQTRGRRPRWYQLREGPNSLQELARHLKKEAHYDVLYRYWSRVTHAHDFSRFLTKTPGGSSGIKGLRDPSQIREVSQFAATFILSATRQVLAKFRPSEDLSAWYIGEVRDRYLGL